MAKSEWQVFSNVFNGVKKYRVGRQLRENEPLHSGNIEYFSPRFYDDEQLAQNFAIFLNSVEDNPIPIINHSAPTNREHLNHCNNDEFAETVLRKAAELESKYMCSELDAFDVIDCIEADFVEWLNKGRR